MKTPSKKGFALIVVLSFVVMVSAVLVAFMMSVMTERSSSSGYAASISARRLGDIAVALVQTQINSAALSSTTGLTWVSQPGMVRTFDTTGNLAQAYKLYSAPNMISTIMTAAADNPAGGGRGSVAWNTKPALWVDLNAPILTASGTSYPIFDPSVLLPISNTVGTGSGAPTQILGLGGSGVTVSQAPIVNKDYPVPMPVQWLYVLADGKIVSPTAGASLTSAAVAEETADNPIVGRIAFWTDDETCKVNINTASAGITTSTSVSPASTPSYLISGSVIVGSYWDIPRTFTQSEVEGFALMQPARGEYQRYPGHPATVSLASLFPVDYSQIPGGAMQYAELLYQLTPRIVGDKENPNGQYWTSLGGTQIPKPSNPSDGTTGVKPDRDRLYTSLDEMMFNKDRNPNGVISKAVLDSRRFFMTAHSRAPETNLFGLPRIATWPIYITGTDTATGNPYALGSGTAYTNIYDRAIGFCSSTGTVDTAGAVPYYFQRQMALSCTNDYVNISKNQDLYAYLQNLTGRLVPGFGVQSFATKYGAYDRDYILTEIFDYIRCMNLNDDTLPDGNQFAGTLSGHKRPTTCFYKGNGSNTILAAGGAADGCIGDPGCGVVAPLKIATTSGTTMGQGRFFTLKQLTFAFISNVDGDIFPALTGTSGTSVSGTNTVTKVVKTIVPSDGSASYTLTTITPPPNPNNPIINDQLEGGVCGTGTAAIQMAVIPEFATTSPGWRGYCPNIRIKIDGLQYLQLNGSSLCLPKGVTSDSNSSYMNVTAEDMAAGGDDTGGCLPLNQALIWARTPPRSSIYAGSGTTALWNLPNGIPSGTTSWVLNGNTCVNNIFPWVSRTIKIKKADGLKLTSGNQDITVSIYADVLHPELVQQITMKVPDMNTSQVPAMASGSSATYGAMWDPTMWTFLSDSFGGSGTITWSGTAVTTSGSQTIDGVLCSTTTVTSIGTGVRYTGNPYGRVTVRATGGGDSYGNPVGTNNVIQNSVKDPRSTTAAPQYYYPDVLQGMVPSYASSGSSVRFDYRLIAGRPQSNYDFVKHYRWGNPTYRAAMLGTYLDPGCSVVVGGGTSNGSWGYAMLTGGLGTFASDSGDFDTPGGMRAEGAFVNKPDEGDFDRTPTGAFAWTDGGAFPYYTSRALSVPAGPTYFSPNRIVPSAVTFGSLPTGVAAGKPWQTLLFRPDTTGTHVGTTAPKDHLLLDLFWMPVVEPYAISDRFSTAGKINMNYQILPFTYIGRDAAMRAVLAPERMQILPSKILNTTLHAGIWSNGAAAFSNGTLKYGTENHWPIDVDNTLIQFTNRFNKSASSNTNVFISPTEICDIHMVPKDGSGVTWDKMKAPSTWWPNNAMTGDNVRERIYATVYPKLTTRSNTFTVHYRVQSLKKSPTGKTKVWTEGVDAITGEYRGSTTIERFIDPNANIPNYAYDIAHGNLNDLPLDAYYKWRVIQNTQFAP